MTSSEARSLGPPATAPRWARSEPAQDAAAAAARLAGPAGVTVEWAGEGWGLVRSGARQRGLRRPPAMAFVPSGMAADAGEDRVEYAVYLPDLVVGPAGTTPAEATATAAAALQAGESARRPGRPRAPRLTPHRRACRTKGHPLGATRPRAAADGAVARQLHLAQGAVRPGRRPAGAGGRRLCPGGLVAARRAPAAGVDRHWRQPCGRVVHCGHARPHFARGARRGDRVRSLVAPS